jgi:hypothetical protein
MRLSIFSIISCLGVILGVYSIVYAGATYMAFSSSSAATAALTSSRVMTQEIDALVEDHEARRLIMGELEVLLGQNASLRTLLDTMTEESKRRARNEMVLWLACSVFFFVLLVRSEHARRCGTKQDNPV